MYCGMVYNFKNCFFQTDIEGKKIEVMAKVEGTLPIQVAWYRGSTKVKSSRNTKVSFLKMEAKYIIFEASPAEEGDYRFEAVNKFGEASAEFHITVNGTCLNDLIYMKFIIINYM